MMMFNKLLKIKCKAGKCFRVYLLLLILLPALQLHANEIEIRYHLPDAPKVILIWGINDWQYYGQGPEGTIKAGRVMQTPMLKEGDDFVVKINIPAKNTIDFSFLILKKSGPFRVNAEYVDVNKTSGAMYYHTGTDSSHVVAINGIVDYNAPKNKLDLDEYGFTLFIFFVILAVLLLILRKYYYKIPKGNFNQTGFFTAVSLAFTAGLFFTRIYITELTFPFFIHPAATLPEIISVPWDDMKFAACVVLFFGTLFFLLKKGRGYVLGLYTLVTLLSLVASLANIRVNELLGRPFNYQWLYYSDFLKSRDASLAVAANFEPAYLYGCLFLLLTFFAVASVVYSLYRKWPLFLLLLFPLLFLVSFLGNLAKPARALTAANPVLYFISSLSTGGGGAMAEKGLTGNSEFVKKNTDSLPATYAASFKNGQVKNVIILVLESTPAEYVTAYDSTLNATPFINAVKKNAAVFENIYAHTPATNKSMFSILCSNYPDLSFTSITKEFPGIQLPSVTSELGKEQYRTLFLNSGDNQFQNAEGFLKARGFDDVLDYRTNNCGTVFSDKRFSKDMLDGVDDSCLSVRFFDWQQQDVSKPFFAMLWTFQTHYPYFNTGKTIDFNTGNPSLDKYLNALHRADQTLRQLVEGLEQKHLLESTLIVVTGDHGEAFGRHNQTTHASAIYEENLHIPLLFINPVLFKGERINTVGGISDIAPTIFSVLNQPAPEQWQGENLFSINRRKAVYFFAPYSDYLFGLREDNYKFIFNASDNSFKLFDLTKDKHETENIAVKKPAFIKSANQKVLSWMKYQDNYLQKLIKASAVK